MGMTLREIIFDIGGGILDDRPFKAVQTGGPSGGCLPDALLDLPVDFERLTEAGSMMGSGGMIVMDDRTCMVDVARYFLKFLTEESCGKCVPCREGLKQLPGDLRRSRRRPGQARRHRAHRAAVGGHAARLAVRARQDRRPTRCCRRCATSGTSTRRTSTQATARPGSAGTSPSYEIVPELCNGCHLCFKACPAEAITGEVKKLHTIDQDKCISCGACFDVCPSPGAVRFFAKNQVATAKEAV